MTQRRVRKDKATRYRKAKSDSSVATMQRTIETKFGLPTGCVKLVYPNGRKVRRDSTVGKLRASWDSNA